jgi:gluconate kinase
MVKPHMMDTRELHAIYERLYEEENGFEKMEGGWELSNANRTHVLHFLEKEQTTIIKESDHLIAVLYAIETDEYISHWCYVMQFNEGTVILACSDLSDGVVKHISVDDADA